jgi:hypothetical protein
MASAAALRLAAVFMLVLTMSQHLAADASPLYQQGTGQPRRLLADGGVVFGASGLTKSCCIYCSPECYNECIVANC